MVKIHLPLALSDSAVLIVLKGKDHLRGFVSITKASRSVYHEVIPIEIDNPFMDYEELEIVRREEKVIALGVKDKSFRIEIPDSILPKDFSSPHLAVETFLAGLEEKLKEVKRNDND